MKKAIALLITGIILTGCRIALPGPDGDTPIGEFYRNDLWKTATGHDLDRMIVPGDEFFPVYRTIWRNTADKQDYLVCLQYPGCEMFGTPYNVFIYNSELQLIKHGTIVAQQDCEPLAIVEVLPESDKLPQRRHKWQLAVVFAHREKKWDKSKPLCLMGFNAPDEKANYVMCELIRWPSDALPNGSGNLSRLKSILYRTAEKGWQVTPDGTVLIDIKKKPNNPNIRN